MQLTERRRASSRRLEDLYRRSIEDLRGFAIFMVDRENRVVSWNKGAEQTLGYTEEEIIGQPASIFLTPEDREQGKDGLQLEMAMSQGKAEDEYWHVTKDGTPFYVNEIVTPVRNDSFELVGYTKVLRDVTRRKSLEEERDRFFTVSMDLMCVATLNGYYKVINPSFTRILGYSSEEILSTPIEDLIHPDDRGTLEAEYAKLSAGTPIASLENRVRCKDGNFKWVEWTYFPITQHGIAYGSGREVTVHKQLEAMLKSRADELEKANRIKDEFLAMLSHELRTPLTAMLGWLHLLRNGQIGESGVDHALEIIERNAKSQAKLIEDLLDVSRIMTGKLRVELQSVTIAPVVETVVHALTPMIEAKNLQLEAAIDPDVGTVMADPHRLRQIVTNLLSNAIKFTPVGGQIQVVLERIGANARLTVKDSGIGITPEVLPFIFDRFRQADSSDRREFGGLGLGLSIVRHLVDRHGGDVRVESEGEGKGATFIVDLPLCEVHTGEDGPGLAPQAKHSGVTGEPEGLFDDPTALEGINVILVEDEDDTREMIKKLLEGYGARVTSFGNAEETYSGIRRLLPDILISDIGMRGTNGYELIRQIRQLSPEEGGRVPAIALTAYAGPRDRKRALRAGYQAHLAKPLDPDELLIVVASLAWQSERRKR